MSIIIAVAGLWLLYSTDGGQTTPATLVKLVGNGFVLTEVTHCADYQQSFEQIFELRSTHQVKTAPRAHLTLENDLRGDNQAVRVSIDGFTVGYLAAPIARDFRREVARSGHARTHTFECAAVIRRGWIRGYVDSAHHIAFVDLPRIWPN